PYATYSRPRFILNKWLAFGTCVGALSDVGALAVKRCAKERRDLPSIYVFIGCLSGCVVAAGQYDNFMIEIMPGELVDDLPGKFRKESQIVLGINDQRFLRRARELIEV